MAGRTRCCESAPPRGGQQVELHGEDQDQHDAQPEGGHRLAEERHHGGDVVGGGVAADGGDDARGNGEAEGDGQARPGQLEGGGHALDHQVEGGLAVTDRLAEVAAQGAGEEAPVLDDEGIVEAHRLAKAPDVLGGRLRGQEDHGGIAGEIQDEEHHEGDAEQDEEGLETNRRRR